MDPMMLAAWKAASRLAQWGRAPAARELKKLSAGRTDGRRGEDCEVQVCHVKSCRLVCPPER